MSAALARATMALAIACLGDRRRDWALAMEAEYEAASADGKPLAFALGCLIAAGRELTAHPQGRVVVAGYGLALGLILPIAALMVATMLAGFPLSFLVQGEADALLALSPGQPPLLNDGNRAAVPPLAALISLLAALHLRLAWLVLDRDWARVGATGALIAAATMTLIIFSALVFVDCTAALGQAAALTVELAAIAALARWQALSVGGGSEPLHA